MSPQFLYRSKYKPGIVYAIDFHTCTLPIQDWPAYQFRIKTVEQLGNNKTASFR